MLGSDSMTWASAWVSMPRAARASPRRTAVLRADRFGSAGHSVESPGFVAGCDRQGGGIPLFPRLEPI